ncbi:hypothetical protein [Microcoleus sp. S13_C5]|uniref:hypothetical protein n=1 Tax=Microcoleus sp. S13_C5 TaxID=3055411 RepID=UPI002FCE907A
MSVWEEKLKGLISPTESKWPYRVVQLKPNRKLDSEIYTLSGREEDIAANGSLFLALYDLAQRDRIDFDEWFEQWSLGFPLLDVNREQSNYPLLGEKQWRKREERPKFKDWTPRELRHKLGYRTIEVWLNRDIEEESTILSGTDMQLINHCIQLEYEGGSKTLSQDTVSSDVIRYSGIPEITLFFRGRDANLPVKDQVVVGQKSFRFMGYTDNPAMAEKRQDLELITQSDINRIGAKIRSIFRNIPPYVWSKGKKQVAYHDWARGYNLNVYASTHAEAERLIVAILAIRDLQMDETFVKYGEAKNPIKAYPPAQEIQVLGKKHKTPERLPDVNVEFQYAQIYLPTVKQKKNIA